MEGNLRPGGGVLEGFRVVEFATFVAGPSAGSMLAQLGADVIKVEAPSGDPSRMMVAPSHPGAVAPAWIANNVGKRSMIVNLKAPEGAELARRLLASADLVLENFREGAMDRLGISRDALLADRPGLIWISIRGYGPKGPWRTRPAVDSTVQADSGMVAVTGYADAPPVKVGFPVVDHAAAQLIVSTALASFVQRLREGSAPTSQHHVVSLFDAALSMQGTSIADYLVTGHAYERRGNMSVLSAPSESVRTRDGDVIFAAYLPPHFKKLCEILGCPELAVDERFHDRLARLAHRGELNAELEKRTIELSAEELFERMDAAGLMGSVIRSYDDVMSSDEVTANGLVVDVTTGDGATYRGLRQPLPDFGSSRPKTLPGPGEHTVEVLEELGVAPERIDALIAAGVVEVP